MASSVSVSLFVSLFVFFFLSLSWFSPLVSARLHEEELTTVSPTSISLTWVTTLPKDTQVVIAECDEGLKEIQLQRAQAWMANYYDVINDHSSTFATLMSLVSSTPSSPQVVESFLLSNLDWLTSYLTFFQPEEDLAFEDEPMPQQDQQQMMMMMTEYLQTHGQIITSKKEKAVPTKFHHITVDNLTPGTTYCYQVMSGDEVGSPTRWSPGVVTTLTPPPGDHLFTFATVNDMHVGEAVAGLIVIGGITLTPGFTWEDPDNPYWKFTNEAAVRGINALNVDFTIAKGDVSSDFKEEEYIEVERILGGLSQPYYLLRGNHDRVGPSGPDYYKEVFGLNQTWYSFDHKGIHFVALDSVKLDDGAPQLSEEQFVFLDKDLATHNTSTTFVYLHHAVTLEAFIWSIPSEDRDRFIDILQRNPQVVGVFSGHSHRAHLTHDLTLKELVFAETPSTKEYPMGFCTYDIYTGGYIQTFHRSICDECLEWNSMTRQEFFRLAPFFQYGSLADKNFVVTY